MYEQLLKTHTLAEVLAFAATRAAWTAESEENAPPESTRPTMVAPRANVHGATLFDRVG